MKRNKQNTRPIDAAHSFHPNVAKIFNKIEKAVLLKDIVFWVDRNEQNGHNIHSGIAFTFQSVRGFEEVYPYMSKSSVARWMNELEAAGWIFSSNFNKREGDKTKWYTVNIERYNDAILGIEWDDKKTAEWVDEISSLFDLSQSGTPHKKLSQSGTDLSQSGTTLPTQPHSLKEKEEKENFIQEIPDLKKRIGKPLFDALLKVAESEENLTRLESLNECKKFELLLQWLEYRNDRKKKLTPKGILILVTKFEQFENEAISVAIEKSIESNYTGLFIKPVQKQPTQQASEPPKDANGNEIRYKPQGDLKGYAKILALRDKIQAQKAAQ